MNQLKLNQAERQQARPLKPLPTLPTLPEDTREIPGRRFRVTQPRQVTHLPLVWHSWFQKLDDCPLQLGFVVSFI